MIWYETTQYPVTHKSYLILPLTNNIANSIAYNNITNISTNVLANVVDEFERYLYEEHIMVLLIHEYLWLTLGVKALSEHLVYACVVGYIPFPATFRECNVMESDVMFDEYIGKKVKVVWEEGQIRFLKGLLIEVDEEHGLLKIEGLRDGRPFTIKYDSKGFRSLSPLKDGGKRV